jgi:hypothetical protein
MAESTDFQIGQGETFKILVRLLNRTTNNTPLDLTGCSFSGQLRENYTTDEVAADLTIIPATPLTSGSVFITLSASTTLQLDQRKYVYDVNLTDSATTRRILEGSFTVRPTVTR